MSESSASRSWPVSVLRSLAVWRRQSLSGAGGAQRNRLHQDPAAYITGTRDTDTCPIEQDEADCDMRVFHQVVSSLSDSEDKNLLGDSPEIPAMTVSVHAISTQDASHTLCKIGDNPYRIHRCAERGKLEDFAKLYEKDPSLLQKRDEQGREPIHCAATKNRVNIIENIINKAGDMNSQDNYGNTALHFAVQHKSLDALDFLLLHHADSSILNHKLQAPTHLAAELDHIEALEVLTKYKDRVNLLQGGQHGRTPLHIAAIHDHYHCAEIILRHIIRCPKLACHHGYFPIHEAAKNASAKTLEVILQWGERRGCHRTEMMKLPDAEGNDALHSAVHSGDIKAVKLCLENGARISSQQHNLSTPVHLAASQGAIEIVKLMFLMQPEEKYLCLSMTDAQQMTPLHCAAMFNHHEIVQYLISEGADINALDKQKRSALLVSAARGAWKSTESLLRLGAHIELRDCDQRTVLHFIVLYGGQLEQLVPYLGKLDLLLDDKDIHGCTPMHYASRKGNCKSITGLINLGARINLKNNDNQSPLHFAARYGRYNTVMQLLSSEKGTSIINEANGTGGTALHISSENGHTRVVQLLLARGALLHRDHNGCTPLHLASVNGYLETMDLLLSFHSHLLDQCDKDGNTCLHLAAAHNHADVVSYLLSRNCIISQNHKNGYALDLAIQEKNPESAMAMVTHSTRNQEFLSMKSDWYGCFIKALIIYMPEVFMSVLDKAVVHSSQKRDAKDYSITYCFTSLECQLEKKLKARAPPLIALNTMVSHGRVELLTHPICQKYLNMKWNAFGMHFHVANLFVYFIFLVLLTIQVTKTMNDLEQPVLQSIANEAANAVVIVKSTMMFYVLTMFILSFVFLNILKELFQVYQQRLRYFMDPINFVEWILYLTAAATVWPTLSGELRGANLACAAVAIFLAWLNFLLYLQRFDVVGIYVVMFLAILNTLLHVLMLFFILFIAFGLAFHILLSGGNHLSFMSPHMSFVRVFSMMVGDIDFVGTFVSSMYGTGGRGQYFGPLAKNGTILEGDALLKSLPFPRVSIILFVIFMILMPILLMNLLIGLAVGDIEKVKHDAQLKRLAMQVELHSELERKLPWFIVKRGFKRELVEYPNHCCADKNPLLKLIYRCLGFIFFLTPVTFDNSSHEEDIIYEEILKQESRLQNISENLDRQYQLLRLIIKKMEIKTEADDLDEGGSDPDSVNSNTNIASWMSPSLRKRLRSGSRTAKE